MSDSDRKKWDQRYAAGAYQEIQHPSEILELWLPCLKLPVQPPARVLDLAAGAGRNSVFLARAGFSVTAVDISSIALSRLEEAAATQGLPVTTRVMDLDELVKNPAAVGSGFDLMLMIRYWDAALIQAISRQLAPGGVLLAEVHLQTDASVSGPQGSCFRASPGDLRQACAGLEIRSYEEGIRLDPDGRSMALATVVAVRVD